jgi:hypothetical protein
VIFVRQVIGHATDEPLILKSEASFAEPPQHVSEHGALARRHFTDMIYSETMLMDENTWTEFSVQAFQMLITFKRQRQQ